MTLRRLALALGASALCLALTGCVNIKSFTGSQTTPLGGVQIVSVFCTSGTTDCAGGGNSATPTPSTNGTKVQLLVGYRVSAGSTPPVDLRFFDDDGQGPLFSQSPTYTAELQRLAPAPAGQQWFGYLSSPYQLTPNLNTLPIATRFGMPVAADGTPLTTFTYLTVAGGRTWDTAASATRPVVCGDSLFTPNLSEGGICIDSPAPSDVTSWKTLAVRDLGIAAGPAPAVTAGQTAAVPFALKSGAGIPANTQVALTASTTLGGATATPAPAAFALASSSTTPATVSVAVPAGTPAGAYPVTLTATVGTDVRRAQGTVTVVLPSVGGGGGLTALPGLSGLSVSPKTIRNTRRAAPATLRITLSQAGNLRIAVTRAANGRRKANGRCVAPTPKLIRAGATRCVRFVPVTTIVKSNLAAGARSVTFSGRGRRAGTYRLGLTLVSGGRVSLPQRTTVTVTG